MQGVRTHYDNLQVTRSAGPEVIEAAYRSLSQRYHPDKNRGDARCERIMRILNRSYAVLSDSTQRSAHDVWIAKAEAQASQRAAQGEHDESVQEKSQPDKTSPQPQPQPRQRPALHTAAIFLKRYVWVPIIGASVAFITLLPSPKTEPSGLAPYNPIPTTSVALPDAPASEPAYARPTRAPNGSAWPKSAGYIEGYPYLRGKGLSMVKIDNSANPVDVFVKLVSIEPASTQPVRQFFVPAYGEFIAKGIDPGKYDVRYQSLTDGSLSRSQSFTLKQIRERNGTRFSDVTMTLYKVVNGNMKTFPLLPSEF